MAFYEMEGWVHGIGAKEQYSWSIVVRDNEDANAPKEKFPQFIGFKASSKKFNKIEGLALGDKIRVKFFINGLIGVSKKTGNPYQINNLMINDITVLQKAEADTQATDYDAPF